MRADEKISADEFLDMLCEDIKGKLRKNDAFGNPSLCFSKVVYNFSIAGFTMSRQSPVKFEAKATGAVGEHDDEATERSVFTASGEGSVKKRRAPQEKQEKKDAGAA